MSPLIRTSRLIVLSVCLLGCASAIAYFAVMQEKELDGHWPWPLNGVVINQSAQAAKVWDDDHQHYQIAAHTRSGNELDVDHVQESATGRWCKVGPHTVTLQADGHLAGCPCFSLDAGRACIQF
jgi:hypothetical protein